jgi:hypothetical protein
MGVALLPAVAFAALILLVDPRGEFPLNDDWSFALSTWHSLEAGRFELAMFSGMALKTQIVWGAAWTALFGKSFFVLRASVLSLALATIVVFSVWMRRWLSPGQALAATLILLIHPIFFWCAFTYMTHVPFVFLSLIAFILLVTGFSRERLGLVIGGSIAIVAAYLLRQTGIGLSIAAMVTLFVLRGDVRGWRRLMAPPAATIALFFVLFFTTDLLSGNTQQMKVHTGNWSGDLLQSASNLLAGIGMLPARSLMNFFLFALPLTAAFTWKADAPKRLFLLCSLVALPFFLAPASFLVGTRNALPTPTHGDILENLGLGPRTLPDVWIYRLPSPLHIDYPARVLFTYLAAAATALFVAKLAAVLAVRLGRLERERRILAVLGVACTVMMSLALIPGAIYFDRHSLDSTWFLIPVAAILFPWESAAARRLLGGLILAVSVLVVGATQEYMNWNRARWDAFAWLKAQKIGMERISGGYEINQYLVGGFKGTEADSVIDDEYILGFSRVPGYFVERVFPYRGYFGIYRGAVLVQRRVVPWKVR